MTLVSETATTSTSHFKGPMKRILSLSLATFALGQVTTHAGIGTILVQNNNGGTIIPVFDIDGSTILKGAAYKIGVYVYGGFMQSDPSGPSFPALGAQVGGFLSPDPRNGRFSGGQQDVPGGIAGGTVQLVVVAWDASGGDDFKTAIHVGYSQVFASPQLGGDVDNDPNTPAATARSMAQNFKSFRFYYVPEPSTVALAALGLGGLLFVSRRK